MLDLVVHEGQTMGLAVLTALLSNAALQVFCR
jgi:hypothetical protein